MFLPNVVYYAIHKPNDKSRLERQKIISGLEENSLELRFHNLKIIYKHPVPVFAEQHKAASV